MVTSTTPTMDTARADGHQSNQPRDSERETATDTKTDTDTETETERERETERDNERIVHSQVQGIWMSFETEAMIPPITSTSTHSSTRHRPIHIHMSSTGGGTSTSTSTSTKTFAAIPPLGIPRHLEYRYAHIFDSN